MLPAAYDATMAEPGNWDSYYANDRLPWDIGRPQAAFVELAGAGEIGSPVLDSGCGTGEHALMLAEHGLTATGIDVAPTAIRLARHKALERGLDVTFEVGDVLALERLARTFATVVDSGVFHVFDDADRVRYVTSLSTVLDPGGVLYVMCFSELTPGESGPRRVSQAELRAAFADGWRVDRIEASQFEVRPEFFPEPPRAWMARIVRT
jgi:SAM-dependent methyltransferase